MNWQPIETAPKDGTHFLGYYADRETYYLIEHVHVEYATHTTWCDRTGFYGITLTHWMPLPAPPGGLPMTSEIKPEDVRLPEPVACFVEPELGVMLWPIGDIHEARLYCDEGEEPGLLFTADQVRAAVLEAKAQERDRAARIAASAASDTFSDEFNLACEMIAAAIRAGHCVTETKRD